MPDGVIDTQWGGKLNQSIVGEHVRQMLFLPLLALVSCGKSTVAQQQPVALASSHPVVSSTPAAVSTAPTKNPCIPLPVTVDDFHRNWNVMVANDRMGAKWLLRVPTNLQQGGKTVSVWGLSANPQVSVAVEYEPSSRAAKCVTVVIEQPPGIQYFPNPVGIANLMCHTLQSIWPESGVQDVDALLRPSGLDPEGIARQVAEWEYRRIEPRKRGSIRGFPVTFCLGRNSCDFQIAERTPL